MLLKRDNTISNGMAWWYEVNDHRNIVFFINRDRSIESVRLLNSRSGDDMWFDIKTLCYMENITIDDGELLNVDALFALARREDNA